MEKRPCLKSDAFWGHVSGGGDLRDTTAAFVLGPQLKDGMAQ